MEKRLIKSLAIAAALLPCSVFAGEMGNSNPTGSIYGELGAGYSHFGIDNLDQPAVSSSNDDAYFTARAGYEFPANSTLRFGVEGGYLYLGKMKLNSLEGTGIDLRVKQQGADLLATVTKDINERFSLFGKAGVAYVKQSYEFEAAGQNFKDIVSDDHALRPEIAGGVKYNLTEQVALTANVNHIFDNSTIVSSTTAGLGLRMTF